MCMSVDAPAARDIGQETRDTLQAQVDLAPEQYAATAEFGPKYAALNQSEIEKALTGQDTGKGYLKMYNEDILPAMTEASTTATSAQRAADIADVQKYGPEATAAFRAANPEVSTMDDALSSAIMKLINGGGLSPDETRQTQQGIRASQAARGLGYGTSDAIAEAVGLDRATQSRTLANLGTASSYVASRAARQTDPFMAILGRSSAAPAMAGAATQVGQTSAAGAAPSSQFDPFNAYASDLYNTNYNGVAAANNASASANAGLFGSLIGFGGRLGGGYLAGKN